MGELAGGGISIVEVEALEPLEALGRREATTTTSSMPPALFVTRVDSLISNVADLKCTFLPVLARGEAGDSGKGDPSIGAPGLETLSRNRVL